MQMVGKKTTFAEAEEEDIVFWFNKSVAERLNEAERLRRMIWTHLLGSYPDKMIHVGSVEEKTW